MWHFCFEVLLKCAKREIWTVVIASLTTIKLSLCLKNQIKMCFVLSHQQRTVVDCRVALLGQTHSQLMVTSLLLQLLTILVILFGLFF